MIYDEEGVADIEWWWQPSTHDGNVLAFMGVDT
jgi:hypothetical protein